MTGEATANKEDRMGNLVETIKMSFQDALSHRGWGPMSRVRRRYTQSCRATNPRPHVRIILIRRKARRSGRCHGRRGWSGRYLGRGRPIVGGALVKGLGRNFVGFEETNHR